jgi:Arc/MetJ-type ribon-helix-helix transcriptional regulator
MSIDVSKHLEQRFRKKLEAGEFGSAEELLAEALSSLEEQVKRQRQDAIDAALEAYLLNGTDPGPPANLSVEQWQRCRQSLVSKVRADLAVAIDEAERGSLVGGNEVFEELERELRIYERALEKE